MKISFGLKFERISRLTLPRTNSLRVSTRVGTGIERPTIASIPCQAKVTASLAPPGTPASSSLGHTKISVLMTIDGENIYHHDFGPGVCLLQIFGNVRIKSAAATHKYLVDLLRRSVAAIMIHNSLSSDSCHSGDNIIWRQALSFTITDEV